MSTAYPTYQGEGSPRFGRRPDAGTGSRVGSAPAHNTSAWSTTSYSESRSDAGYTDVSYTTDHDVTRASRDVNYPHKDTSHRDATFSRRGDTSSDTDGPTSYDFFDGPDQKTEWSCNSAGGCQKLSFLLLVITFLGHGIAVCTPYYVMGWSGDQAVLHEGLWLSCYREQGVGRWICGTFDHIRKTFEEPVWHEMTQILAVLSAILLLPTLVVGTLYSYVDSLRGRSKASWVFIVFMICTGVCSFLSLVIFGACYPYQQGLASEVRLSYSYVLHSLSFLVLLLSLVAHVFESYPTLKVWENKAFSGRGLPKPSIELPRLPKVSAPKLRVLASPPSTTKTSGRFALPKFPAPLSRFRSKAGNSSEPGEKPSASPAKQDLDREPGRPQMERARETTDGGSPRMQGPGRGGEKSSYRSYAASNDSLNGYDSQV